MLFFNCRYFIRYQIKKADKIYFEFFQLSLKRKMPCLSGSWVKESDECYLCLYLRIDYRVTERRFKNLSYFGNCIKNTKNQLFLIVYC